jgi:hypothetical protein
MTQTNGAGTQIILLSSESEQQIARVDAIRHTYEGALTTTAIGSLRRSMVTAAAIHELRKCLTTEVMQKFMPLANTALGFLTDRGPHAYREDNKIPYTLEQIREILIEAALEGLSFTGNRFNVISGRLYRTVDGYRDKLRALPGVSEDRSINIGQPVFREGRAVARVTVVCLVNGKEWHLRDEEKKVGQFFDVATNKGSTVDQVFGKARRKAYKAAFEAISGMFHDDDDAETLTVRAAVPAELAPPPATKADAVLEALNKRIEGSPPTAPPTPPEAPGEPKKATGALPGETGTLLISAEEVAGLRALIKKRGTDYLKALLAICGVAKIEEIRLTWFSLVEDLANLIPATGKLVEWHQIFLGDGHLTDCTDEGVASVQNKWSEEWSRE